MAGTFEQTSATVIALVVHRDLRCQFMSCELAESM